MIEAGRSAGPLVLRVTGGEDRAELLALLEPAARALRAGRLVAFPTETVYGLGANALDPAAVRRIFEAKGRPAEDPIIVHVLGLEAVPALCPALPTLARRLAEAFWPGPLTLIVPRGSTVPLEVTAGLDSVALRAPAHPVARALLEAAGLPIAAPSANPFGRTSPTRAEHVLGDLGDRVDVLVDGGECPVGVESTVVDCRGGEPRVLRPGGVSVEELAGALGAPVPVSAGIAQARGADGDASAELGAGPRAPLGEAALAPMRSPGTMLRHYAPRARVLLVEGSEPGPALLRAAHLLTARGHRVGLLLAEEDRPPAPPRPAGEPPAPASVPIDDPLTRYLGSLDAPESLARGLFAALRELDALGADVILARDFGHQGLALAVRDRLRRAAEGRTVTIETLPPPEAAQAILAALPTPS